MSITQPVVPTLTFQTKNLPREERFAAWKSALPIYEVHLPEGQAPQDFEAAVDAWFFDDFIVTESRLSSVGLRRTPARIRDDGVDSVNLFLLKAGENRGDANGQPFFCSAGQIAAYDLSQPFAGEAGPTHSIAVSVARTVINRMLPGPHHFHGQILNEVPGTLLAEHMLALVRHLPNLRADDAPVVSRVMLAHVIGALTSLRNGSRGDPMQGSILVDARRYIEGHLSTVGLTPDRIAADLGITRSSLYRSFEMLGGVSAYIQQRRLQVVRMLLTEPTERRPIAELAETFGFTSPAHFATAFRRRFGVTPREFRATQVGRVHSEDALLDPTSRYRAWIKRLG